MNSRVTLLVSAALITACGSSSTNTVTDAGETDGGEDALTCQQATPVPDAAVYMCEAGLPGSAGCRAPRLDPNATSDPNVYPEGCLVTLPLAGSFCGPDRVHLSAAPRSRRCGPSVHLPPLTQVTASGTHLGRHAEPTSVASSSGGTSAILGMRAPGLRDARRRQVAGFSAWHDRCSIARHMTPRALIASSLILTFGTAACRTVPVAAPAMPEPAMPEVAAPEVAADSGLARVLIGTDVPASVSMLSTVSGHRGPYTARTLVCAATPCALTLPYADYEMEFAALEDPERTSVAVAHVNASTVVVNHTLGRRHSTGGAAGGTALIVLGMISLVAGLAVVAKPAGNGDANSKGAAAGAAIEVSA